MNQFKSYGAMINFQAKTKKISLIELQVYVKKKKTRQVYVKYLIVMLKHSFIKPNI